MSGRTGTVLAAIAVLAGAARADSGNKIDWAHGRITATGLGIADRQAPSPAAAREPARRAAEDAARQQIAAALPALPVATGGTLADALRDSAVKARVDRAVAAARVVDAEPSTDGSWRVTLTVPLEAVRQAVSGPRLAPASDHQGPPIVIVTGASTKAKPALGYQIGKVTGPVLWAAEAPAWAKGAPRVAARTMKAGVIELAKATGSESTLFVIVGR